MRKVLFKQCYQNRNNTVENLTVETSDFAKTFDSMYNFLLGGTFVVVISIVK